jgi:hypothetical protein
MVTVAKICVSNPSIETRQVGKTPLLCAAEVELVDRPQALYGQGRPMCLAQHLPKAEADRALEAGRLGTKSIIAESSLWAL